MATAARRGPDGPQAPTTSGNVPEGPKAPPQVKVYDQGPIRPPLRYIVVFPPGMTRGQANMLLFSGEGSLPHRLSIWRRSTGNIQLGREIPYEKLPPVTRLIIEMEWKDIWRSRTR